jgi:autotransporter adhesin
VGAERTITNVAAGRIAIGSTDAINGSQLFATNQSIENLSSTVNANRIRYYSVNSTGGGNEDNLGATGANAIASGKDAAASGANSIAQGLGASATVDGAIALGSRSVSDRFVAGSTGDIPAGSSLIPYNTTDRTLLGAVSVGSATSFRQITNVADGTQAQDAVTVRQLSGALQSFAVTPIQYFHANSTAMDSLAIGAESVAVGPRTVVNGDSGVGIGNGAVVQQTAPGGVAIGQGATSHRADSIALGTQSSAAAVQGVAIGAGTSVTQAGGVALGAGSVASTAAGAAGYVPTGASTSQIAAIQATTSTLSAVSVGDAANGQFRQINGVAAGSLDSDAVNVSQLRAVQNTVASVDQSAVKYETNADGSTNYNSVSLGGTNTNAPVSLHNVANGVAGNDAVNVNQLNAGIAAANQYTDAKVGQVQANVERVSKEANAAAAGAMAMANLPQAAIPGKSMVSAGVAGFDGQAALALGVSKLADNGRWIVKFSGTANSRGKVGVAAGMGFHW